MMNENEIMNEDMMMELTDEMLDEVVGGKKIVATGNVKVRKGPSLEFGVLGYLMRKLDLNTAAVVLALILGPIGEKNLLKALTISGGSIGILFQSVVSWVLIALCVVGILSPIFMAKMEKKAEADAVSGTDEDVEVLTEEDSV